MKLSALRQQLAIPVEALGHGRFLPVMHELLQRYDQGEAIRSPFPNKIQYRSDEFAIRVTPVPSV